VKYVRFKGFSKYEKRIVPKIGKPAGALGQKQE
jgi:hypothetical protein